MKSEKLKQKFHEDLIIYGTCGAKVCWDEKTGEAKIMRINPKKILKEFNPVNGVRKRNNPWQTIEVML